jgi:hypothetical protein
MKAKGNEPELVAEAVTLLNLLRDIRDELRYVRHEVRDAHGPAPRGAPDVDELLSVEQVAAELQVIPQQSGRGSSPARYLRADRVTAKCRAVGIVFAGRTWKRSSRRPGRALRPHHDRLVLRCAHVSRAHTFGLVEGRRYLRRAGRRARMPAPIDTVVNAKGSSTVDPLHDALTLAP